MGNTPICHTEDMFLKFYTSSPHRDLVLNRTEIYQEFLSDVQSSITIVKSMQPDDFKEDNWLQYDNRIRDNMKVVLGNTPNQYLHTLRAHERFFQDFVCTFVPEYRIYLDTYSQYFTYQR
jgi:hypothetical protein